VEEYVSMRQREKMEAAVANERSVMTARRLLSILRLAQGLARLRWHDEVETDDVEEAIRLVHAASNIDDPNEGKETEKKQDVTSRIYRMICECVRFVRFRTFLLFVHFFCLFISSARGVCAIVCAAANDSFCLQASLGFDL
jgi:hypothetical protein